MKVAAKVRFNASKERCEKFGENMYLIYLQFEQDDDSPSMITSILSRELGVPISRLEFAGFDVHKNWIFEML